MTTSRMKRWLMYSGAAALLGLVLLAGWGVLVEPRLLDERRIEGSIPGLPERWRAREVALVADLQLGMWFANTGTIDKLVASIVRRRPALVLIAGDFIYEPSEDEPEEANEEFREEAAEARDQVRRVVGMLKPIPAAGLRTFAVLGNHDYGMQWPDAIKVTGYAAAVRDGLERVGIEVLHNEAVRLHGEDNDDPFYLVGIGPRYPGEDDVRAALAGVPRGAPRLLLMHNPRTFEEVPEGEGPLCLAGHTHGGQVRLPFLPDWSWMTVARGEEVVADGWAVVPEGAVNRLYVNRGIGFSVLPVRINCRPELTYITLRER